MQRLQHRLVQLVCTATFGTMITSVAFQGSLLISGIIAARTLGVEDRGHLALLQLFPIILSSLGCLGLPLSLTYVIARDDHCAGAAIRSIASIILAQAVILVVLHLLILAFVLHGATHPVRLAGIFSLLWAPSNLIAQYGLAILQGRKQFLLYNLFWFLLTGTYCAGLIALFLLHAGNLPRITLVAVVATATIGIATFVIATRNLPCTTRDTVIPSRRSMISFGLKGLLGSSSPMETFRIDQAVIGLLLSPSALGLYVVAVAFTNLPRLVAMNIGKVAYPRVAEQLTPTDAYRTMWMYFALTLGISVLTGVVLEASVGVIVPLFFGATFAAAVGISRILLINVLFLSIRRVLTDGARGGGHPAVGTVAEITSWACLLPLLALCVPRWGITGVGIALTLSSITSFSVLAGTLVVLTRRSCRAQTITQRKEVGFVRS